MRILSVVAYHSRKSANVTTEAAEDRATTSSNSLSPPLDKLRVRRRQEAAQPTARDTHRYSRKLKGHLKFDAMYKMSTRSPNK